MSSALLVVDVQRDFTEGGSLAVAGGAAVASAISAYLRTRRPSYALVAASRDWHAPGGDNNGHFAPPGAEPDYRDTWPAHCVAGTPGADYHPDLDVSLLDLHVTKGHGQPAYSAFEGVTADGTDLATALRDADVTAIDVCGIATDYCVRASALDAVRLGFAVTVLAPLTAGVAEATTAAAIAELREAGAAVPTDITGR